MRNPSAANSEQVLTGAEREALASQVLPVLQRAGEAILSHYSAVESVVIHIKEDRTPLTTADLASHEIIGQALKQLTPDIPVLSEEADIPELEQRRDWPAVWLVDPLDGTREFIDANDQFCISVALVENGSATIGLIHSPVLGLSYCGIPNKGCWRIDQQQRREISCRSMPKNPILISGNRRFTPDMLACEDYLKGHFGEVKRLVQGSAMKFCMVAEGKADIYPCFGPTGEWDTAAGQAIVEAAGGSMMSLNYQPFRYNQRPTMLNGGFFTLADTQFNWRPVLERATA